MENNIKMHLTEKRCEVLEWFKSGSGQVAVLVCCAPGEFSGWLVALQIGRRDNIKIDF